MKPAADSSASDGGPTAGRWDEFSGDDQFDTGQRVGMARAFAETARSLSDQEGVEPTLVRICQLAAATIPGCENASISLVTGRQVTTAAATGQSAREVDRIQYETGEGPCLNAIEAHEVVQSSDLRSESRWPNFSKRAASETGVRSMLSFRLFKRGNTMGALNLFSTSVAAFDGDREALEFGAVFSAHAAIALAGAQEHAQLNQALRTREVIGQATGILAGRQNVSVEAAFVILSQASQRLNLKLRDIAQEVVNQNSGGPQPSGE